MSDDYSDDPGSSTPSEGALPIGAPAARNPERWALWERIPHELRERHQWLLAAPDGYGALKVPMSVNNAGEIYPASSKARATWLTFTVACWTAYSRGLGIGYVLAEDDPFTCIDIDVKNQANAPHTPEKWTTPEQIELFGRMLYGFNSYAERSQSMQGVHIWVRGKIGSGVKRDGVEVYSQERFMVCTGSVLLNLPIADRQDMLTMMVSQMRETHGSELQELPAVEPDASIWCRASTARNGEKFQALCNGMWTALGYPSQSEADMALIGMLAFYTRSNEQVRRMFHATALGQRRKAHRVDYTDGMLRDTRAKHAQRLALSTRLADAMSESIDAGLAQWKAKLRGWSG